MCVPRSSALSGSTSRARRLVELISAQPTSVRQLAFERIGRAAQSDPAILDTALGDPDLFIHNIRASIEQAATPPLRGDSHAGSRTQVLMGLLRSEPMEVRELAHAVLISAGARGSGPDSRVDGALDNPRVFIREMRALAQVSAGPGDIRPNHDASQPASERGTREPQPSVSETLEGLDPEVFHGLPDDIRAELLSLMPTDPYPAQGASVDVAPPVPEPARPAPETVPPSSPSPPAGEQVVEEVSWPRVSEWLRSRTGPRPQVLCVWCQDEVVISDGDLQPEDGEREPAYQLPCSHIVGQRCLKKSLEVYGVRVTRCPFCRAGIGDVYG